MPANSVSFLVENSGTGYTFCFFILGQIFPLKLLSLFSREPSVFPKLIPGQAISGISSVQFILKGKHFFIFVITCGKRNEKSITFNSVFLCNMPR